VRRLLLVFAVMAVMAAMVAAMAVPAFAAQCDSGNNPHCVTANPGGQPHGASQTTTFVHP
jgi:hypothetical protein